MNTPSPLSPLSPLAQAHNGKSNVRLAVISIFALHAVFFGGLLLLGCKKSTDTAQAGGATNTIATNELAPLTNSPYSGYGAPPTSSRRPRLGSPSNPPPRPPRITRSKRATPRRGSPGLMAYRWMR